jgi:ABC-type phosphate/phosphonate transport system ATPase subunit
MLERSKTQVACVIGRWYNVDMKKRSRKHGMDLNRLAKSIVDQAVTDEELQQRAIEEGKNPAAVVLGRLGGLKGGKARAEKLSAQQRVEIARKAAQARWRKQ